MITIDQFRELELKVGTVTAAEPHPNADRLVVLSVDLGEEQERQLVAGIRASYEPESLVAEEANRRLYIVAGRQVACREGLEVLVIGTRQKFRDG